MGTEVTPFDGDYWLARLKEGIRSIQAGEGVEMGDLSEYLRNDDDA